jgi:hypothetical protein
VSDSTVRLVTPQDVPAVVAAAGLAMTVLARSGLSSWSEVAESPDLVARSVDLGADQVALLNEHAGALSLIRAVAGEGVTIAACARCGRFLAASSAPTNCTLTAGCTGTLVKARSAAQAR